jgi:predicted nucleic acid-binding protein
MNVFCDTSVLVAASLETHVHYAAARVVLDRVLNGVDVGCASAHSLAETFSVLSRMPTVPKLTPQDALAILERNIVPHFQLIALSPSDYPMVIRKLAVTGMGGGRIHDLLHLEAARKHLPERIYTLNEAEWKALAPDLRSLIAAPLAL